MLSTNNENQNELPEFPPGFFEDPEVQKLLGQMSSDNPDSFSSLLGSLAVMNASKEPSIKMSTEKEKTPFMEVQPEPGFVIKTISKKEIEGYPAGLKVFINVCHNGKVPPPPLATNEEIRKAIEAEDNSTYKVPLSLSSPRTDLDKSGKTCIVFDACVNTDPIIKSNNDFDYKLFLIELSIEWVEEKYKLELSREFSLPKMKVKGKLVKHLIRRPDRPYISEVDNQHVNTSLKPKRHTLLKPDYEIRKEPKGENATNIIIEIKLPDVNDMKETFVDIEKDRVIFQVKDKYSLDLRLPILIDTEEGKAQFDRETHILTINLVIL